MALTEPVRAIQQLRLIQLPKVKPAAPLVEQPQQLLSLLQVLKASGKTSVNVDTSRFIEVDGQKHYRHWHFPGTPTRPSTTEEPKAGEEVLIPVTPGDHGTHLITESDARYLQEQEALKAEGYVDLKQINARIDAEEKTTDGFYPITVKSVQKRLVDTEGGPCFVYYAITETNGNRHAAEKRLLLVKSGKGYYFKKEDAELIIKNEIAKRGGFYHISKVRKDLGITNIAMHYRIRSGNVDAIKCGSSWVIRKESAERAIQEKRVDTDMPEKRRPISDILQMLGVSKNYFDNKLTTKGRKLFFVYETIKRGKVIEKEIRVYTDSDRRLYVSSKAATYISRSERQVKKWPTTQELMAQTGLAESTLSHNHNPSQGTTRISIGRLRYVDIRYVVLRNKARYHHRDSAQMIEFIQYKKSTGEIDERRLPSRPKSKRTNRPIALSNIEGAQELLTPHIDEDNGAIHLTESVWQEKTNLKSYEYYRLGIPCKILRYDSARGKQRYSAKSVMIDRDDAELVDFYVKMLCGTEEAKERLNEIIEKARQGRILTTNEVMMVIIARFLYMRSNKYNDEFLTEALNRKKGAKKRKWVVIVQERIFNPRTLARIPERYWVPLRKGAHEDVLRRKQFLYPSSIEHGNKKS